MNRLLLSSLALFSAISTQGARLELRIQDASGNLMPARLLIRPQGANCVTPEKSTILKIGSDTWFMSPGRSEVNVSAEDVLIRAEHGLEFLRFKKVLRVPAEGLRKTITLTRWINMKERGYLSGENHLHLSADEAGLMAVTEGLDFGSSMTWWNGPDQRRPIPAGTGMLSMFEYGSRTIPISIYDAELEYGWGAAYIQYLPAPMPFPANRRRPNLDFLNHAVEAGAIVHYQAGWSREVGLDALLGYVHTVNVCNNNFHMHRFQPRQRYSNLLGVEGFPNYPNTEMGMLRMNTDTYYRLLNWGLKLAAGAGSATGVKQVPVGYNRAYVRVSRGATLKEFNNAWIAGKNFVSNGPMLFLSTDAGKQPGDEIEFAKNGGELHLNVRAIANQPLQSVELVMTGEVVKTFRIADPYEIKGTHTVKVSEGAWIAARCVVRDEWLTDEELAVYRNGENQYPGRIRFAHTSPIYVSVGGTGAVVRTSIEEGLKMMDRIEVYARNNAATEYLDATLAAIAKARSKLVERLKLAK